jgi:hypothetical protein
VTGGGRAFHFYIEMMGDSLVSLSSEMLSKTRRRGGDEAVESSGPGRHRHETNAE